MNRPILNNKAQHYNFLNEKISAEVALYLINKAKMNNLLIIEYNFLK